MIESRKPYKSRYFKADDGFESVVDYLNNHPNIDLIQIVPNVWSGYDSCCGATEVHTGYDLLYKEKDNNEK